jgi:hypothetical protein
VEAEGSSTVVLSMASSAFVCACCMVTGEVACGEKMVIGMLEGKVYTKTDLFECMACHGERVKVVRSDEETRCSSHIVSVIEHSHYTVRTWCSLLKRSISS